MPRGGGLQRQELSQVTEQALSPGRAVKQRPAEASFRVRLRSKVTRATHSRGSGRGSSLARCRGHSAVLTASCGLWGQRSLGRGGMSPRPGREDLACAKGRKETQTRQRARLGVHGVGAATGSRRPRPAPPSSFLRKTIKAKQRHPTGWGAPRLRAEAHPGQVRAPSCLQKALPAGVPPRTPAPWHLHHPHPAHCRPLPGPAAPRHVRIVQLP